MQLNTYISTKDYETLYKAKPAQYKSVASFMADIIRQRAAEEEKRLAYFPAQNQIVTIQEGNKPPVVVRDTQAIPNVSGGGNENLKLYTPSGTPIIPQYERQ